MTRPVNYPNGAWPLEMRAATAAGFCDEPSVEAFQRKVDDGIYPAPTKTAGAQDKGHRSKLEQAIARRQGVQFEAHGLIEDLSGLV